LTIAALAVAACTSAPASPAPRPSTAGPTAARPTGAAPTGATGATASTAGAPTVDLRLVARLEQPTAMAVREGDPALYVAEKVGRVVAIRGGDADPTPVLDVTHDVSLGSEQGLLGIAFSPDGAWLYVDLTDTSGDTRVLAYAMGDRTADAASRREILFVGQPYSNHNGGQLAFGSDGDLYIGLGDGGGGGDPQGNGQSLGTLLGKILRIDPTPDAPEPYRVPPDNPFVGTPGARPEIWDLGLRNPWRFSFDAATGDLWIGDVGQSAWEEIDLEPAGSGGGRNYGWNAMEGTHRYAGGADPERSMVDPIFEYPHDGSVCAVTGGYRYRGSDLAELRGWYVFADFCGGSLEAIRPSGGGGVHRDLGPSVENLASFGEDAAGELYAMSLSGPVYRLVAPG
jgi:glucose/arabinose dehydrogenase